MSSAICLAIAYIAVLIACVRWLDRLLARPPLIELNRYPGADTALERWRHRYEAERLEETRRAINARALKEKHHA